MHALYLFSVFLHIVAAIIWVGGIAFLVLVVVPWLRTNGQAIAPSFLRDTGMRFRRIGWHCFATLVVTGAFNLWIRGVTWASFGDPVWLTSPFGYAVLTKLSIFGCIVAVSLIHDFLVGPRATKALASGAPAAEVALLRKRASMLGRLNGILALAIVLAAVVLVRGAP